MRLSTIVKGIEIVVGMIAIVATLGTSESSAAPLALKVVGPQILNSNNEPVRLRGVNCASLEWSSQTVRAWRWKPDFHVACDFNDMDLA